MPNGHGGAPRYPILSLSFLLGILGGLWVAPVPWWTTAIVGHIGVIYITWRTCFGKYMWGITEYGGAYSPEEKILNTEARYRTALPFYLAIGMLLGSLFQLFCYVHR